VLVAAPLWAADDPQAAVALKAQAKFERVELAGTAGLPEADACIQSQAAALAIAPPAAQSQLHYRKGFCLLAEAAATRRPEDFSTAAAEFDRAIQAWPDRMRNKPKHQAAEPVSEGLRALAAIARLQTAPDAAGLERARGELAALGASPACASDLMTAAFCGSVMERSREWLGWMALQRDDRSEAARNLAGIQTGGWPDWAAGSAAFTEGQYPAAVQHYRAAIGAWQIERRQNTLSILQSLSPRPDFAEALADWGGAQLLAGQAAASIATLDLAVREDPARARPLYLRARAREATGDLAAALSDYNLAGRTAFAVGQGGAAGEAHLYRGIMLYRRKDFTRAEDEFSSALNFQVPERLRGDAEAWRHLAAVAAGSCGASREHLERSLGAVSPYFPRDEARALLVSCATATRTGVGGAPTDSPAAHREP